jgi:hypothetical protein
MARLSDEDYRIILGEDFARKIQADMEHGEAQTPQERAAAAKRQANKLGDLRFTLGAVIFTGVALLAGAHFNNLGFETQAMCGVAAALFGAIGLYVVSAKRRKLIADHGLVAAQA